MHKTAIASLAATSALLTGCASAEKAPQGLPSPEVSSAAPMPSSEALTTADIEQVIKSGLAKYKQAYGCPTDVTVRTGVLPAGAQGTDSGTPGIENFTFAIGSPGEILVSKDAAERYSANKGLINLNHIAVHEAVHACQGAPRTISPAWHPKGQDLTIRKIQGLSFVADEVIENGSGNRVTVNEVEEGAAEVLADSLAGPLGLKDEQAINPPYYRLKQLTLKYMKQGNVTNEQLAKYVQTSNLLAYIGRVTHVASPKLDTDVFRFEDQFQSASYGK